MGTYAEERAINERLGSLMLRLRRREGKSPRDDPRIPGSVQAALPGVTMLPIWDPENDNAAYVVPGQNSRMVLNLAKSKDKPYTDLENDDSMYHEADHLINARMRGHGYATNYEYDDLAKKMGAPKRLELVKRLAAAGPYLKKEHGVGSVYFMPEMVKAQEDLAHNLLAEQLASLSALQQSKNVQVTNDPYLRAMVFEDRPTREIVDSLMGLRMTRLDAKDLQPYTPMSLQPQSNIGRNKPPTPQQPGIAERVLRYLRPK